MSMAADSGNMPSMMVLGDYIFSINTLVFQEWKRTTEWKWPNQERFGQLGAKQFTGRGEDSLELPGVLYPNYKGDINGLETLRNMADDGKPYLLVDSMGYMLGRWVIERLDETQTHHQFDGKPQKVDFTLRLSLFDDTVPADDGSSVLSKATTATTTATAATSTTASALSGLSSMVKTVQSAATTAMGELKSAAAQVQSVVAPVMAEANSAIGALNRGVAVVKDLKNTATEVAAQVSSIGSIGGALSGAKTIMEKIDALGVHAASATRVISNISAVAGSVPTQVTTALSSASKAASGVETLLANTSGAASSLIKSFS